MTTRIEKEQLLKNLYAPFLLLENNPYVIPGAKTIVFGEGPADAQIMFIGEAPGREEDLQGRPFVGRSGKLLTATIERLGLPRKEVYITNIVKTRPPNNRTPSPKEIAVGRTLLSQQIEIIEPKIICALGASAVAGLDLPTIQQPIRMGQLRGKIFDYHKSRLIVTFHPSYILRNQSAIESFISDLLLAKEQSKL
jgi:DNA polymerase